MAKKTPWYAINQTIYHNDTDCIAGKNLDKQNVRQGTGDHSLCKECKTLNV